jgi:Tfp pilus assembly protein PilP
MKPLAIILLIASLALVAACGESKQDKAKKQVCSARNDIQAQVKTLQGLTLSTATTTDVKDGLNSIRDDLKKITDAQGDLNDARKSEVQKANQEFASQFQTIASSFGTSLSLTQAQAQLKTALGQLGAAYQKSFAQVDCS